MCFSATASFTAAGILIGSGIAAFSRAETRPEKLLSGISLIFGAQQLAEGIVWLNLDKELFVNAYPLSRNLFLFIAWMIWPVYIPIVFRQFTRSSKLRSISAMLVTAGLLISLGNGFSLLYQDVFVSIQNHHILYEWTSPRKLGLITGIVYVICTLLPPFLTGNRYLYLLGTAHIIMFVITYMIMREYLVSVWCFLAAVSSGMIYWIISRTNRPVKETL